LARIWDGIGFPAVESLMPACRERDCAVGPAPGRSWVLFPLAALILSAWAPAATAQLAMTESIQSLSASASASAATEGAPATPAAPDDVDRPEWIVNVATYADVDLARRHAQRLATEGFEAAVREEKVRGRSSYRVVIESLSTESAAQSALTHLADRDGERAAWVMRKR
jgi:cell division protein FtsN